MIAALGLHSHDERWGGAYDVVSDWLGCLPVVMLTAVWSQASSAARLDKAIDRVATALTSSSPYSIAEFRSQEPVVQHSI